MENDLSFIIALFTVFGCLLVIGALYTSKSFHKERVKHLTHVIYGLTGVNSPIKANEVSAYYAYLQKTTKIRLELTEKALQEFRCDVYIGKIKPQEFSSIYEIYDYYNKKGTLNRNPTSIELPHIFLADINEQSKLFKEALDKCKSYIQ